MQQTPGAVIKIIKPSLAGDVVVATTGDARIIGLVAALMLDAQRARRDPDPILAALRSGQRQALRRLAGGA